MGPFGTATPNPGGNDSGFGPSQLAGESTDPSASVGLSPDAQSNALSSVVSQVRGMEQGLQGLAQQFPAAAPEVRNAIAAVRAVLQRVVSSPMDNAEPAAPNSLA